MARSAATILRMYVNDRYKVLLGERTAAEIVTALLREPYDEDLAAEVRGRDLTTGDAKTIVLSRYEIRDAVRGSH